MLTVEDQESLLEKFEYSDMTDLIENNLWGKSVTFSVYGEDNTYIVTTKGCQFTADFDPKAISIPDMTQELKDSIDLIWSTLGLKPKESSWYLGVSVW